MGPFYMTELVHEPWKFSSGTYFFLYYQFFYNGMQLWNGNMLVSNMRTFKLYWLELSIKETMLMNQSWFFWFMHITFEWPMIAKYSILNPSYVSLNQECHVKEENIRMLLDDRRQGHRQGSTGSCISLVAVVSCRVLCPDMADFGMLSPL